MFIITQNKYQPRLGSFRKRNSRLYKQDRTLSSISSNHFHLIGVRETLTGYFVGEKEKPARLILSLSTLDMRIWLTWNLRRRCYRRVVVHLGTQYRLLSTELFGSISCIFLMNSAIPYNLALQRFLVPIRHCITILNVCNLRKLLLQHT